ncbi:MAG: hypothetical protein ABIQ95_01035 [Bdellovibrionia bacterium]
MLERRAHELSNVNARAVTYFALWLMLIILSILLGIRGLFFSLRRSYQEVLPVDTDPKILLQREEIPEPRLQPNPPADLKKYLNQENQNLSTYGWINRPKGIARIPINRAMQLWIEQAEKRDPSLAKRNKDAE